MGEAAGEVTGWEDRPRGDDLGTTSDAAATPTGDPEVDQLVTEIEVTRVEMTSTVEEIGDRLDPKNIVAGAKDSVREATVGKVEQMANSAGEMVSNAGQTAQQAGSGIVETIRRNPVPAAMAGIGLGWLAMSARSSQSSRHSFADQGRYGYGSQYGGGQYGGQYSGGQYGGGQYGTGYGTGQYAGAWDTGSMGNQGSGQQGGGIGQQVGDKVGQVGQTAGDVVGNVQQTVGQAAGQVGQTVGQVAEQAGQTVGQVQYQAQTTARQLGDNAGRMYQENPLAMGAIAVAVGAAVGMMLPATPVERRVLGQASNQVVEKAETAASDALTQAEQQARDLEDQARQEDQQARGV